MRLSLRHHDHAVQRRRERVGRAWAILVLLWSVARTLLVWATVGGYGLNPWLYFALDLASASVAAVATPRMICHFVDERRRRAASWAGFNLGAFLVPDAYIVLGSRRLPTTLLLLVCVVVTATLTTAIIGVRRKVRAEVELAVP